MFGYVRPALTQLPQEEKDLYQSAYCGLCHEMGKRHGFWTRFTLNYDLTLLAILLQICQGGDRTVCQRGPAHPIRKPKACLRGPVMDRAADVSLTLTSHEPEAGVKDPGVWTGPPSPGVRRGFHRH